MALFVGDFDQEFCHDAIRLLPSRGAVSALGQV
jgi:hypothetical protein